VLAWNSRPVRLYILEGTALAFALLTLLGLVLMAVRRWRSPQVRGVTTVADWLTLAILLVQVVSGIYVAVTIPWGSSWFATLVTPYLWSLLRLSPTIADVAVLPLAAKLHIVTAFLLILFFPFTRLVHILVVPNPYLWRKPQVVRWSYGRRAHARGQDIDARSVRL
jgi:nitrate reductase gamma subunit